MFKTPLWNLNAPEDKFFVSNGKIETAYPTTYKDGMLRCSFTFDASIDFDPPSKFLFLI